MLRFAKPTVALGAFLLMAVYSRPPWESDPAELVDCFMRGKPGYVGRLLCGGTA